MVTVSSAEGWADALYRVSLLKQEKVREIAARLPNLDGLRCLDIGGDNGVASLMLRRLGGEWTSADLDAHSVEAISQAVDDEAVLIIPPKLPWPDETFDVVVLADCLEHIQSDAAFVDETVRVLKPGGTLIANTPYRRPGLLRRIRLALGQTDERHGHVRQGYTRAELEELLSGDLSLDSLVSYSRFFTQLVDVAARAGVRLLGAKSHAAKGTVVTQKSGGASLLFARLLYPLVWLVSRLDYLILRTQGYMLVARATKSLLAEQAG